MFDTMDQQLFNLARTPAVTELVLKANPVTRAVAGGSDVENPDWTENQKRISFFIGPITSIFMLGWAMGGFVFGVLGDKIGRARTMVFTILLYAGSTGLSALSVGLWDFGLYRFLTGLGVGGEFAVGVALVAESMPDRSRPFALGWLQALSALGHMAAALISMLFGALELSHTVSFAGFSAWRVMFLLGAVPALLAIVIRTRLNESDRWKAVATRGANVGGQARDGSRPKLGSFVELFIDSRWRRNTIVGMLLAFAGVVGLWGIGFFSFDLIRLVFREHVEAQGLSRSEVGARLNLMVGVASLLQNGGAFFGIHAFSRITHYTGRRPAFAIALVLALISTAFTFLFLGRLQGFWDVFWMTPIMGFCQVALFGGYAIYFPELFPTRLRSTGISFCYNVGRLVAAVGPSFLTLLSSEVYGAYELLGPSWPMRLAGVTMCASFLIGLLVLPFAPETKGTPLPE
jgi:MFS family permease